MALIRVVTRRGLWMMFVLFAFSVSAVLAQAECPADVVLAHARAGGICTDTERGTLCYGNGSITPTLRQADSAFIQPGDRISAEAVESLTLNSSVEWSIAALRLQTSIADLDQRSVFALLFGDVQIDNLVPFVPELLLIGRGSVNVRAAPIEGADILASITIRGELIANGRTEDGLWLRVIAPSDAAFGWILAEGITPQGDLNTLNIVTGDDAFYRPFQQMTLHTGVNDAPCLGAPESGMVIQTPNTQDENVLIINDITLRLAGTAYVQRLEALSVTVLDGYALVDEQYVPAGARFQVQVDSLLEISAPLGYAPDESVALPINFLEYRVHVANPLTPDEITAQTIAFFAPPEIAAETAPTCRYLTLSTVDLHSGPGSSYPITYTIAVGRRVYPLTLAIGDDGLVWWQVRGGNWLRPSRVDSRGTCAEIPVTGQRFIAESSTNTLSLETCLPQHGPLVAGQHVTIEFVPRAWATVADALDAPRRDWGRITIGDDYTHLTISDPIQIATDRWVRVFSAEWVAEAGTFRIAGDRLAYQVICSITVPVG
ncbi:MAG: hypothetical protein H7Y09_02205 [Chitinophagaceae bacterium]|nr:hypothetical protein [Anaerolineae bacterium]